MQTRFQDKFHLITIASAADRDTLVDIAQKRQQEIALEIGPLRQVPGEKIVLKNTAVHGKQGVRQDDRIDHGQMIGTDHPGSLMRFEQSPALPPDRPNITDTVPGTADHNII
jgi:hypothetical protein